MSLIAMDCDGVLADFVGEVCKGLTRRGYPRQVEEFTCYDIDETLSEEERWAKDKFTALHGFCRWLEWYEGTADALVHLNAFHDVYILTAPMDRNPTWAWERRAWLRDFVPAHRVCSVPSKSKAMLASFADILVEDNVETCRQWVALTGRTAYLVNRPWNQEALPAGVVRINHIRELLT